MPTNSSVPKLGPCSVPCGSRGPWTIDEFEIKPGTVDFFTITYHPEMYCPPGKYKRLLHKDRGVVMSNTRDEVRQIIDAACMVQNKPLVHSKE